MIHKSYEKAKSLKSGDAKLEGLRRVRYASQLPNMINVPTVYELRYILPEVISCFYLFQAYSLV